MSKQPQRTSEKPAKRPKLVGVYVRPREEHWAELLGSVDSAQAALDEGRFAPEQVALSKPRMQPVYETEDGQRVLVEETPSGLVARPFNKGPLLEFTNSDGLTGGYLPMKQAPPLPLVGGASAADWVPGYMARIPEYTDLGCSRERWGSGTQAVTDAVAARTSPEQDEWRRRYFAAVRDAAAKRDHDHRSSDVAPKSPRHFTNGPEWSAEEYHGGLFKQHANAAEDARHDSATARTAAPEGVFAHSPTSRLLALAGAIQKNGADLPVLFHQTLEPELSARLGHALQAHLREQAQAQDGQGAAVNKLRGALDILKKLNEVGAGKLLAGMLENLAKSDGQGAELGKLKGAFIKNLAQMGLNQGLEKLMGNDAASLLAGTGVTGLFADAAKNLVMDETPGLVDGAEKLLAGLPNKVIDMGFDKLLGEVDDRSSMAKQLLAKYKDQITSLLKKLISPGGLDDLQKKWDAIWKSVPSKACVPLGLAEPMGGTDMVYINGVPATRIGDICKWPMVPDAGPFFQGNPTILINGLPPSGAIHAAKGAAGTIGTPLMLSPNVLMGEATVSVKIRVSAQAPSTGQSTYNDDSGSSGASSSSSSSSAPSKPTPTERGLRQIDTRTGPNGRAIPVYFDPDLVPRGQYHSNNDDPYILVGPHAEVPPGSTDAILGPDGKYYNPCVVAHEMGHVRTDWGDNKQYDGSPPDDETNAAVAGLNCAKEKGYKGYAVSQARKINMERIPEWVRKWLMDGSPPTSGSSSSEESGSTSGRNT